ncbi:MAG: EboA domain-containing protein [Chitinophagaceae bacterium]
MNPNQIENIKETRFILTSIIRDNLSPGAWGWLAEKCVLENQSTQQLNIAFVSMPRKTGRALVHFTKEQAGSLSLARPHFSINSWTIDRLCRVWLLLHIDASKKESYFQSIETLCQAAEMNELVALYSSLPVLSYPEMWHNRCAEGIRTNIGIALEAIICNNPYPSEQLSESAWNQLVMKAFFTEKPIDQIIGLDERANPELAQMLSDYANERWAASRNVNPQLWRCVGKFIDESIFPGIRRIYYSDDPIEQEAAALACNDSDYPAAKTLLYQNDSLKSKIDSGELTWNLLAKKTSLLPG